jgi:hypothetical protein
MGAQMKTGVVYAMTDEGEKLAVIDVTNAAFAVSATDDELAAMAEKYILEAGRHNEIPAALRDTLRSSKLGRGLMAATGTFVDGMTTYQLKLGPENLGEGFSPIDQRIAASFPAFTARLRLQDMARLMADGLAGPAMAESRRRVCLVNIGGGPGSDSWNSLICFREKYAHLLADREIVIAILDFDERGPAFGARALGALCAAGAPLRGLKIELLHFKYEWSCADRLREALHELRAGDSVCGISSEGALFEYGSDEEIVSNLQALLAGTAADSIVVGSVTRDGKPVRASLIGNCVPTRPRTIEAFRALAEQGGWVVQNVLERPFSYNVRLVKA